MGEFRDGEWIPDGRGPRHDRLHAAKRAMRLAHGSDRPIEAAAGDGRDPAHRAARQLAALTHSVDPDEISAKDISAVLEHQRQSLGHDDKSSASATSALNAQLVDELAEDTDDNIEDITARSDEDEHDYEDSDADRFAWLEHTYGLTADQLAVALQELDPETRRPPSTPSRSSTRCTYRATAAKRPSRSTWRSSTAATATAPRMPRPRLTATTATSSRCQSRQRACPRSQLASSS